MSGTLFCGQVNVYIISCSILVCHSFRLLTSYLIISIFIPLLYILYKTLMNKDTQPIRVHYHARRNKHATNIFNDTHALTCMIQYTCTITDAHTHTLNHTLGKTHAQILKHQTIMQQHALNSMHSTAWTQWRALNIMHSTA